MDISSWIRLKVPPERAFDIISDFSSYKYFEQMLEKVKVQEKTDNSAKGRVQIRCENCHN
jgi:ribosome-associated toxin RatA of RatAB toxin-antitoxin module